MDIEQNQQEKSPVERIHEVWERLERELPADAINPPATPEAIADLEAHVGRPLPEELRASLLRHDGTIESGGSIDVTGGWLLSMEEMKEARKYWLEMGPYEEIGFKQSWLPVFDDVAGNIYCVDLETASVVCYDHEQGPEEDHSESWPDFLVEELDELEELDRLYGDE